MGKNWVHQEGGLDVYFKAPAFHLPRLLVDKKQMLNNTPRSALTHYILRLHLPFHRVLEPMLQRERDRDTGTLI